MNINYDPPERPELLAGYADGELSPADRATVEAKVGKDPSQRDELTIQQRLSAKSSDLWRRTAPPTPTDAAWDRVLAGIKSDLTPATPTPSYRTTSSRPRRVRWSLVASAIAAMLLVVLGSQFWPGPAKNNNVVVSTGEALQLVHADDVTIMSVQGDDSLIVIGRSPLTGPLDLVTVGDTELWAITSDVADTSTKPHVTRGDPKSPFWIDKLTPVP